LLQQGPGLLQPGDRLEQGHEADARHSRCDIDQASVGCEHGDREHIVGAFCHGDHVRLDRVQPVTRLGGMDHLEQLSGFGLGTGQLHRGGRQRPSGRQVGGQQPLAVRARELLIRGIAAIDAIEETSHQTMSGGRVLSDVHRGQGEPERCRCTEDPVQRAEGDQIAAVLDE